MKIRRGFVTNSSSTNDIFTALGTAAAAAVLGTVINVVQPSKNSELISYALLETTHVPEEPRPPRVRVNDSLYTAWFYAAVRCIDVLRVVDEDSGEESISVMNDEYNNEYTSQIKFDFPGGKIMEWLTFGSEAELADGTKDYTSMDGDYKICGFMSESIYNDRPRRQRQPSPSKISFNVSVMVKEKLLSKYKECIILDEADVYAYDGYALNDSNVESKFLLQLLHKGHYSWDFKYDIWNKNAEEFFDISLEDFPKADSGDQISKYLVVRPKGKELQDGNNRTTSRLDVKLTVECVPSASHIEKASDNMTVTILNEGLFLASGGTDNDGNLCIKSYFDKDAKEDKLVPTPMSFGLVIKNEEKNGSTALLADMKNVEIEFKELEGTIEETKNLVSAYKYKIDKQTSPGLFNFQPELHLPESKIPYLVTLPVRCTYENEDYELEVPIKLIGQPYDAKQKWDKEFENLLFTIKKYLPAEQWAPILEDLEKRKDKTSAEMLRLMRRSIFETARDNLTKEAAGYEQIANVLDWTVTGLEAVKWVGDQAFSYLMATYTGPVGEAIIVPFKDIMTMIMAEYAGQLVFGTGSPYKEGEIVRGVLSNIFTSFENYLMMDSDKKVGANLNVKQLGIYLAAFSTWKFMNHYFFDRKDNGEPIGFWDALIETCKDLTTNCFKILVTKKLEAALNSEKAKAIFQRYMTEQIKAHLTRVCPDWQEKGADIAGKYISEFGGLVSSTVYGKAVEKAGQVEIDAKDNDTIITINLYNDEKNPWLFSFSLNAVKEKLYDYIYDATFSIFPSFATSPISTPDDPIFYKK